MNHGFVPPDGFVPPNFKPMSSGTPFSQVSRHNVFRNPVLADRVSRAHVPQSSKAQEAWAHKGMERANEVFRQMSQDREEALKAARDAQDEVNSVKAMLEHAEAMLEKSKQEVEHKNASIETLTKELQSEKSTAHQAQGSLERSIQMSKKELEEKGAKIQTMTETAKAERPTVNNELERLRDSVKTLENRVLPTTPGERVWISIVVWGARFLYDEDLYKKCREYANNRWNVPFTNEFFGCDPMPGTRKSGVIAYQYDGKGLVKYLGLPEGENGPFDPWP